MHVLHAWWYASAPPFTYPSSSSGQLALQSKVVMSAPGTLLKRNTATNAMKKVRLFSDVDSDSDVETVNHHMKQSLASLSVKRKSVDANSDISFQFDSETKRGPSWKESQASHPDGHLFSAAASAHKTSRIQQATPPEPVLPSQDPGTPLAVVGVSSPNTKQMYAVVPTPDNVITSALSRPLQPLQHDIHSSTTPGVASHPPLHKALAVVTAACTEAGNGEGSDREVNEILPFSEGISAQVPSNPVPCENSVGAPPHGNVGRLDFGDALLIRAHLRLDEKRRTEGMFSTTAHTAAARIPTRGMSPPARCLSPGQRADGMRFSGKRDSLPPRTALSTSKDPQAHRLARENYRLQEEINFLSNENKKLRAAAGSSDATELAKLQLTNDLLRNELCNKEIEHQGCLQDLHSENTNLQNHIQELTEESEGYGQSAAQYQKLYNGKIEELELLKTEFQGLLANITAIEQRQQGLDERHRQELSAEIEKCQKVALLHEDVKRQRQHLQELNTQLQGEIASLGEERRRLKESCQQSRDNERKAREAADEEMQTLCRDVNSLKKLLEEKERSSAIRLRDEQKFSQTLQQRINNMEMESKSEADRLAGQIESIKVDCQRTLQQEKERRAEAEEVLQRIQMENRETLTKEVESISVESEQRVKIMRHNLQMERAEKDELVRQLDTLDQELVTARSDLAHQSESYRGLSVDFAHSEDLRVKLDGKCANLARTLEELMYHDELQSQRVVNLEALLSDAQHQLGDHSFYGNATEGIAYSMQQLSDENERLTGECLRLAGERDSLIEDSGKIAEELLKWKNEMRHFVSSQLLSTRHR